MHLDSKDLDSNLTLSSSGTLTSLHPHFTCTVEMIIRLMIKLPPGLSEVVQSEAPFTGISVSRKGASLLLNHSHLACYPSEWTAPNSFWVFFLKIQIDKIGNSLK